MRSEIESQLLAILNRDYPNGISEQEVRAVLTTLPESTRSGIEDAAFKIAGEHNKQVGGSL